MCVDKNKDKRLNDGMRAIGDDLRKNDSSKLTQLDWRIKILEELDKECDRNWSFTKGG